MGWQSDWLYQIIFNEYRKAWEKAQREGRGDLGPASELILIREFSEVDYERPTCCGDEVSFWTFTGDEFSFVSIEEAKEIRSDDRHGMFYKTAVGAFHISSNRKRVVIEYTFGPRYGRGFQCRVQGQGKTGRLVDLTNSKCWHA